MTTNTDNSRLYLEKTFIILIITHFNSKALNMPNYINYKNDNNNEINTPNYIKPYRIEYNTEYDFVNYVLCSLKHTLLYDRQSGNIIINLRKIGNFKILYNKTIDIEKRLGDRLLYKIQKDRIIKLLEQICNIMRVYNTTFSFTRFNYELFEVIGINDMYFMTITNNLETNLYPSSRIDSQIITVFYNNKMYIKY